MQGRVLSIAGTDPSGGAGIQADIKTITALGGYAMTAITAQVAQNTTGVYRVLDVPADFIAEQIALTIEDIGVDAIKTGMLHTAAVIETVCASLRDKARGVPLVVDPVMVAKSGDPLLDPAAIGALRERLLPLATVITPNLPEAEALAGMRIATPEEAAAAGRKLLALGPRAVAMKGGHGSGDIVRDLLVTADAVETFESPRLHTPHTHGTGCTLSAALATGLAQGLGLRDAFARAHRYTAEAIRTAPGLGYGHGPLNHGHAIPRYA